MGHFQPLVIYRSPNADRKNSVIRYIGNRVMNANKNFLCAVVGCLSKDTKVYCQDKTLEELYKSGEKEINTMSLSKSKNKSGTYYPVNSKSVITYSGKKNVFEIELENGKKVYATSEHTFFKRNKNTFEEVEVNNLKVGDELRDFPVEYITNFFSKANKRSYEYRTTLFNNKKMYTTKIKSIKKVGVVDTYDLETPLYHNYFLDNGILSHNSTGSGKSWVSIAMAEEYAKIYNIEFDPRYHVISSLKELLLLITEPESTRKIKFGSVLVFDEPQVEGNARDWQSDTNRALSQLISTFRNQRLIIFFATPYLEMIDKQSRLLFHGEFKVDGYDRNTGLTTVKPRFLEYNKTKGDFYRKRLIIQYKTKDKPVMNITKLHIWHVARASQPLIDLYELKKKKFTEDLNKKLLNQIELSEKQEEGKNKSDELFRVQELYNKFGENYVKILEEMPHLSPFTVEKYVFFIKKSRGLTKKRQKDEDY